MSNIGLEHVVRVTLCSKYTKSRDDYVDSFIVSLVNFNKETDGNIARVR